MEGKESVSNSTSLEVRRTCKAMRGAGHRHAHDASTFSYLASAGAPEVDGLAQADCEHILLRPVDKVEVEVVLDGEGHAIGVEV